MNVVQRQFEQLQQITGESKIPIKLLRLVEKGNEYRAPIFGGGYMNGPDLVHVCVAWAAGENKRDDLISSYMEYLNYEEPVSEPVREVKVTRKKVNA